ncbi:MAG: hypothetical protein CMJ19_17555 [Phycisphaeraceae bacterium]|nr:hypothetical protein [Phycisphaeraceae bacterium]
MCFYLAVGPNRVLPGDEMRFIETSRTFSENLSLNLLKHYEEMSTPLPFIYFGAMGKIIGFELWQIRLAAIIIAVLTLDQLCRLGHIAINKRSHWWLFIASCCLANPYFLPMSTMVYTDMLAVLFVIWAVRAFYQSRSIELAICCAGMLLCRQYMIFLIMSFLAVLFIQWLWQPRQRRTSMQLGIAVLTGCLPFVCLVGFWGSLTPDNHVRQVYINLTRSFHITSLVLYISLCALYCLPVIVVCRKQLLCSYKFCILALILSQIYWYFPVRVSPPSEHGGYLTVGLAHRLFNTVNPSLILSDIVFYIGLVLGIWILSQLIADTLKKAKADIAMLNALPLASVLFFLLIMPWSYLHWEKYFLPAVPFMHLLIMQKAPQATRQEEQV